MIIYKCINKISNKVYIGKTIKTLEERIHQHIKIANTNVKSKFHKALISYGFDNFEWSIIDNTDSAEKLNQLEIDYINEYNSIYDGYNMIPGGTGGYNQFAVDANKMKKGKRWEEIYSEAGLLKMITSKEKSSTFITQYNINLPKEEKIKRAKNANKARTDMGYKHSLDTKHKIGNAQRGITNEMRYGVEAAIRLSKKVSEATKAAMKNVDRELLGKKSVEARIPYWNKKHESDRIEILKLKEAGYKIKHICAKLDISVPTYYKRLNETKNTNNKL